MTATVLAWVTVARSEEVATPSVAGQPLAANVDRLISAYAYLGSPLPDVLVAELRGLISAEDSQGLQRALDSRVLFAVSINPELRVKVQRGVAGANLQQAGFKPVLVKVLNDATVTRRLTISSLQAGPVYAGAAEGILKRQAQTELKDNENIGRNRRFLELEMFDRSPMTSQLSGLEVEYRLALIYCSEAGKREAVITFDIGEGTQDLGFRSDLPVLFNIETAIPVTLAISDHDGKPTTGSLEFRDRDGHVYPPQAKRLAPDLFFQPQIYRADGDVVLLPPGEFDLISTRGPEYLRRKQRVVVQQGKDNVVSVNLVRWVNPQDYGFYCGDHHIHGAGCSHYDNPTEGIRPADMFAQVKGEGLNVGCVLTWGPCFAHQRTYFSPLADTVSEDKTVLKYDLEISGFGSAALGHVCLLNLKDQTYPGSDGTATKGWPKWTVPVMRWAKQQGGVTGYPHSALAVDPKLAAEWQLKTRDQNSDGVLSRKEAEIGVLAERFTVADENGDQQLSARELQASADRAADQLPNHALPSLNGGGAMEIFVSTSEGVCDFISAMDTARIPEWNTWYHLMNCGYRLKLSGETDFPCMSSRRVGQGRVYVQLGKIDKIDFGTWCRGIAAGRAYVSDGFAHALRFSVNGQEPGTSDVTLAAPGRVAVSTSVAFAPEQPRAVAYGTLSAAGGKRIAGDTVNLHAERDNGYVKGGHRLVEIIVNGEVVDSKMVVADGQTHDLMFKVPIRRSGWIAVRQFPQLHTNPVYVIIDQKPVRADRRSALWCAESVRLLWKNRRRFIDIQEQPEAEVAYRTALDRYLRIAQEAEPSTPVNRFSLE